MNQKAQMLAHCTVLFQDSQSDDEQAAAAVFTAQQAVITAQNALKAAESAEARKLGDLQSTIDDATDAEQKASTTYSDDLLACPGTNGVEKATIHSKMLARSLRIAGGVFCDPSSKPPQFCPGRIQCPKCGQPTCLCPQPPPSTNFTCNGAACVQDPGGKYQGSTCDNQCATPPKPPLRCYRETLTL